MKRSVAVAATVAVGIGLTVGIAWGKKSELDEFLKFLKSRDRLMTAVYTDSPPAIDGVLGPGEWADAIPVHVKFNKPAQNPGRVWGRGTRPQSSVPENQDDLSFSVRTMYDDDNVYIAVDVADDIVVHDGPDDFVCNGVDQGLAQPWWDDDVELFFDGDLVDNDIRQIFGGPGGPNAEGFQVLMDVNGDALTQAGPDFIDWEGAPGMRPRGFLIEFRVALKSIDTIDGVEIDHPGPGSLIRFSAAVQDDEGDLPQNNLLFNAGTEGCEEISPADPPSDTFGFWFGSGFNNERSWG